MLKFMRMLAGTFIQGQRLDKQVQVKLSPGTTFTVGTSTDTFTLVEHRARKRSASGGRKAQCIHVLSRAQLDGRLCSHCALYAAFKCCGTPRLNSTLFDLSPYKACFNRHHYGHKPSCLPLVCTSSA